MANLIFAGDFVEYVDADITVRTENTSYPKANINELWHLKKHFRAEDANTNDWLIKIDMGAATALAAVFLNDVNFDKITIQGHATDVWTSPSFTANFDIAKDERVQRYKAYCALMAFNYQWIRIFIQSGATRVADPAVWAVGTLALLSTDAAKTITLSVSNVFPYEYEATKPYRDNPKLSGGKERIGLGRNLIWKGEVAFGKRHATQESELWAINALDNAGPIIFFENEGDTQYVYLCTRDNDFHISIEGNRRLRSDVIRLEELV